MKDEDKIIFEAYIKEANEAMSPTALIGQLVQARKIYLTNHEDVGERLLAYKVSGAPKTSDPTWPIPIINTFEFNDGGVINVSVSVLQDWALSLSQGDNRPRYEIEKLLRDNGHPTRDLS
mgnify:CR=1 FL=1|jgi:hypothetical protein